MASERYGLVHEVVEPTLFNPDDCSSTKKSGFSGGFLPAAGALELSFSTWTRELSSPMGKFVPLTADSQLLRIFSVEVICSIMETFSQLNNFLEVIF